MVEWKFEKAIINCIMVLVIPVHTCIIHKTGRIKERIRIAYCFRKNIKWTWSKNIKSKWTK